MKKILLLIGLILAALLAYYCVSDHSVKIQNDIKSRLTQNFAGIGISDNVGVDVSGRDITLRGTVSDESDKNEAGKVASELYGVRAVSNLIKLAEAPSMAKPEPVFEEVPDFNQEFDFNVDLESEPEVLGMPEMQIPEPSVEVVAPILEKPVVEMPELEVAQPIVEVAPAPVMDFNTPLTVNNARIIRRDVDLTTARKTVEAACESNLTSVVRGQKINFDSGRATIKKGSYDLLDRVIVAAKACDEDSIITINGYTDNTGNAAANRTLSLQRARAVGRYMLKRGVAKEVKVVGNGANDPIADNGTELGRAKNRRIEFKVFKN